MTPATPAPTHKFPIRSTATPAFRRAIAIAAVIGVLMSMAWVDEVTATVVLLFVAIAGVAGFVAYRYATAVVTLVAVGAPVALFIAGVVALLVR